MKYTLPKGIRAPAYSDFGALYSVEQKRKNACTFLLNYSTHGQHRYQCIPLRVYSRTGHRCLLRSSGFLLTRLCNEYGYLYSSGYLESHAAPVVLTSNSTSRYQSYCLRELLTSLLKCCSVSPHRCTQADPARCGPRICRDRGSYTAVGYQRVSSHDNGIFPQSAMPFLRR